MWSSYLDRDKGLNQLSHVRAGDTQTPCGVETSDEYPWNKDERAEETIEALL